MVGVAIVATTNIAIAIVIVAIAIIFVQANKLPRKSDLKSNVTRKLLKYGLSLLSSKSKTEKCLTMSGFLQSVPLHFCSLNLRSGQQVTAKKRSEIPKPPL